MDTGSLTFISASGHHWDTLSSCCDIMNKAKMYGKRIVYVMSQSCVFFLCFFFFVFFLLFVGEEQTRLTWLRPEDFKFEVKRILLGVLIEQLNKVCRWT